MSDVRLTGKVVSFSRLTLNTGDPARIQAGLAALLGEEVPQGFGTPVIVEVTEPTELNTLLRLSSQFGLQIIAVVDGFLTEQALRRHLAVLPADQPIERIQLAMPDATQAQVVELEACIVEQDAAPEQNNNALVSHETLRGGQQLINQQGDILLLADANNGSEMIATGSIHVQGAARGRIVAGIGDHPHAVIRCRRFEVELVSIAGTYCLADDIPPEFFGQPTQIYLNQSGELAFTRWDIPS